MSSEKFELDGSGFVFNLFHLLWLEDPIFKNNLQCNIPDTIQIQMGQPQFWYYSSDSKILRKGQSKLTFDSILDAFVKDKEEIHTICAVWITQVKDQTVYEYLSQKSLYDLIQTMSYETVGYIQKFIPSKGILCDQLGSHNSVIKCTWGNSICFFEMYTNKYPINMQKADIYQRAVTFEMEGGPVIISSLKGSQVSQQLELLCGLIVSHATNVTMSKKGIAQMEVMFKITKNNKIYLLCCTRAQTISHAKISQPQICITNKIASELINYPKAISLSDNSKCIGCEQERNQIEFTKVRLVDFIKYWENNEDIKKINVINQKHRLHRKDSILIGHNHAKNIKMDPNQSMPPIIKLMYPKLTVDEYLEFRKNCMFLNQTIQLCSYCSTEILQIKRKDNPRQIFAMKKHHRTQRMDTMSQDDIFKIEPQPTHLPKRLQYLNFTEHKVCHDYAIKKLNQHTYSTPDRQYFKDADRRRVKQLELNGRNGSVNGMSQFKTTQSSKTMQILFNNYSKEQE